MAAPSGRARPPAGSALAHLVRGGGGALLSHRRPVLGCHGGGGGRRRGRAVANATPPAGDPPRMSLGRWHARALGRWRWRRGCGRRGGHRRAPAAASWAPPSSAGAAALASAVDEPRVLERFHLRAGQRMPVSHTVGGECATVMAVPADGDLADLRLRVAGGPDDRSPDPAATVHVCPDGPLDLEVRATRGDGTVWLLEWPR